MNNYIFEYYQAIKTGTIVVGHWVILWYEYVVHGLQDGRFAFEPKKAGKAIRFIENFCRHHEGALAPQLIRLELWQKAFVSVVFGVLDAEGRRQFREVILIVARKNGKTLFAAAIAVYCIIMDGEYGARIYFAAPKLEQASICYDAFYQMLVKEPELAALIKKRRSDIYIAESNSSAKELAFNSKKSDGLNISLCVADEIASWPGVQGLRMYEVIASSFGARTQPLLLSISTAGYINEGIYLAQGGIVYSGSAIVGEAGPELLTVSPGRTVVQPLPSLGGYSGGTGGATPGVTAQQVQAAAQMIVSAIEANNGPIIIGDEMIGRANARYQADRNIMMGGAF